MILKIVLTLPHGIDKRDTIAWRSMSALPQTICGYTVRLTTSCGANIHNVRNIGVNESGNQAVWQKEFNFDLLLFVDYDIEFTAAHVEMLIAAQKDIIGGLYLRGDDRYEAGHHSEIRGRAQHKLRAGNGSGIVTVDYVGAGFLMIDKNVFENLPFPWFRFELVEWEVNGKYYAMTTCEDVGFCMHAQKKGFIISAHTGCIVKHHKGGRTMDSATQQEQKVPAQKGLDITVLENNISRACTQILASMQMVVDQLRRIEEHNRQLREKISTTEKAAAKE